MCAIAQRNAPKMNLDKENNDVENYALELSLEFGENFGKDISERLMKKFPHINAIESSEIKTCREYKLRLLQYY